MQRLPTVEQTSHSLPSVFIKIQGSGCLKILTHGLVTLATLEPTFYWEMQALAKV